MRSVSPAFRWDQARCVHVRADSRISYLRSVRTTRRTQPRIRRYSDGINDIRDRCRACNHDVARYLGNCDRAAGNRRRGNVRTAHCDGDRTQLFIRTRRGERRGVGRAFGDGIRRVGRCAIGEVRVML